MNELQHYGTLGMKWGIRKDRQGRRRGRATAEEEKPASEDYTITREYKSQGSRSLSNEQLRRVNERLELESRYSQLSRSNKPQKGQGFVSTALKKAAGKGIENVGGALTTYTMAKAVEKVLPDVAKAPTFKKFLEGATEKKKD